MVIIIIVKSYWKEIYFQTLIKEFSVYYIFRQDNEPAHWTRKTIALLAAETPEFMSPSLWPPNSPDLNPVDYKIWAVMQEMMYKQKIRNVGKLR